MSCRRTYVLKNNIGISNDNLWNALPSRQASIIVFLADNHILFQGEFKSFYKLNSMRMKLKRIF